LLDEQECRWFLPGPTVGRARVRVAAPLYDDADGCPVAKPFCERGALLAGDDVVTTTTFGPFTCVTRGDVHGYVPTSALATLPALPSRSWIGTWLEDGTGPARLVFTSAPGGELDVVGHAEWHGWGDNVHIGDFHARGRPDARGSMSIKDDEGLGCELGLRLVGRILLVEDNDGCGGTNVRFVSAFMTH
jgi:hypothetical protein